MHHTYMKMQSSTLDFKVQYSSIVRVYLLETALESIARRIALDPPIRKGKRFTRILAMFNDDEHLTVEPKLEAEMEKLRSNPSTTVPRARCSCAC